MVKKPQAYKQLRKVWYDKLKAEGFVDIENTNTDYQDINVQSSQWARKRYVEDVPARQAYYYMANTFLNEHEFVSSLEKVIWDYHSNALSYRKIADTLEKAGVKHHRRWKINQIVKRLKAIMLDKYLQK